MSGDDPLSISSLRRRVRLVGILYAAERAGLAPLRVLRVHTLAYLSNILAPVWDLVPIEGKVLRRRGGPFYPALQHDLDQLVGRGLVEITGIGHALDEEGRWRLEGSFALNTKHAQPILTSFLGFEDEQRLSMFLLELAFAISALSDEEFDRAMTEDATYTDPIVSYGRVIDFGEWQEKNAALTATARFGRLVPGVSTATPGERLHLYVRHLHSRLHRVAI